MKIKLKLELIEPLTNSCPARVEIICFDDGINLMLLSFLLTFSYTLFAILQLLIKRDE